ncbi:riboflavin kinase, partial [Staphylococcus pasteuri]|uniref:riboflavin kinase n=1 Tax=Staphylococcus pasteuri TaxID=45972 RepID=UPI0036F2CFFE
MPFPTPNLHPTHHYLLPKKPLYPLTIQIPPQQNLFPPLPNLPLKPTFHHPPKPQLLIQLNIFHFHQNIYPQPLVLYSHHFLTPQMKFHGID